MEISAVGFVIRQSDKYNGQSESTAATVNDHIRKGATVPQNLG
jgi:hypothetical protein